jgi:hypothetical protein
VIGDDMLLLFQHLAGSSSTFIAGSRSAILLQITTHF